MAQSGSSDPKDAVEAAKHVSNITQQVRDDEARKLAEGPKLPKADTVQPSKPTPMAREVLPPKMPAAPKTVPSEAKRDPPASKQEAADWNKESAGLVTKALQIISEESGIAIEELTDSSVLADVGIDSLLSLMISSRFRDELALDVESTVFVDLPTIKELKDFLVRTHVQQNWAPRQI